jgi:hypothetical protein
MDGYRYGPARIDVEANDAGAARWLREFLIPWFDACPPGAGDFSVRLTVSASAFHALEQQVAAAARTRACFCLDSQLVELPSWTDAEGTLIADARLAAAARPGAWKSSRAAEACLRIG